MAMEWQERFQRLREDLERLSSLPTMSEFFRRYWALVLSHLERCENPSERLLSLCEAALAYEVWRHRVMTRMARSREMPVRYLVPLGIEMHLGWKRLLKVLNHYRPQSAAETAVWELLRAFYFRESSDREQEINSLTVAWEHGARSPLVALRLGFARYQLALRLFARWDRAKNRFSVTDPETFRAMLWQAVADFDRGLAMPCDAWMEARLQFWKSAALVALEEYHQARACYERAKSLAPDEFSEEALEQFTGEVLRQFEGAEGKDAPLPAELVEERRQRIAPISEEELEQWRKAVMEMETVTDLLKGTGEKPSGEPGEN